MSGVSGEMGIFSDLASYKHGLSSGSPILFGDISGHLEDMPMLLQLLTGQPLEIKEAMLDTYLEEQRQKIINSLSDTIMEEDALKKALFPDDALEQITSEDVVEQVSNMIDAFIETVFTGLEEVSLEENPFETYLRSVLSEINQEKIDEIFEGAGLAGEIDLLKTMLSDSEKTFLDYIDSLARAESGTYSNIMFDKLRELEGFNEIVYDLQRGTIDAAEAMRRFDAVLSKALTARDLKKFESLVKTMETLKAGGLEAAKAYANMVKEGRDLNEAQWALNQVMESTNKESEDYTENMQIVADYLGMSVEDVENHALAQQFLAGVIASTEEELSFMLNQLARIPGITIDTTNIVNPINATGDAAADNAAEIAAFIAKVKEVNGIEISSVATEDGGRKYQVRLPNVGAAAPRARRGGASRGGGGGGGRDRERTDEITKELQNFLDKLSRQDDVDDFIRDMIQLTNAFHNARGEITATITMMEYEIRHVEGLIRADEKAIEIINEKIRVKQKEIDTFDKASNEYAQAVTDLNALQDAHKEYSKRLVQNKTDIEDLKNSIIDARKRIRDMEIEIVELVREGFENRARRDEQYRDSRVEMENTILEVVKQRYQEEWDLIRRDVDEKRRA